jgi:hypothetical protein
MGIVWTDWDPNPPSPRRAGSDRIAEWQIDGSRRSHQIAVVSSVGERMLDALVDGRLAAKADRPSALKPWAVLELGVVDGCEVCAYLESRDDGATFVTDLFVDGFSELTGEPISTLDLRIADAEAYPTWVPADHSRLVTGIVLAAGIGALAYLAMWWYVLANWGY